MLRNRFLRDVVVLAGGTAGAQAMAIVFSPLITRLYGPEAFGVLGTFMALAAIISPLAALSYPVAMVLPRADSAARGIARLSLVIAFSIAAMALVILVVADNDWLAGTLGVGPLGPYLWLVPLVLIFAAWQQIAQQWLVRTRAFKGIAGALAMNALLVNLLKAGGGLLFPSALILIGLQVADLGSQALMMARAALRSGLTLRDTGEMASRGLARQYREFALYRTPQNVINALSQHLPVIMLVSFFGAGAAGFYALARMVLYAPSLLVSRSVGDVFYPALTKRAQQGMPLAGALIRLTLLLLGLVVIPFGVVMIWGPGLFALIFGREWAQAGEYAQWLALMMLFGFCNRPCVVATATLRIQRGLMIYELFSTGLKIIAMYWGLVIMRDDGIAVALFSVSGALSYIALIVWVIQVALRRDRQEARANGR